MLLRIITLFCILTLIHHSKAISQNTNTKIYKNEKEILFKSGKQSVKAFEGSLLVPENRNNPNSRMIPLHYVRFPATKNQSNSPIIYLAGGPGGSGISTAQYPRFRFPLFMAMREFGDVIAFDQRGTGKSKTAPKCTSKQSVPLNKVISPQELTLLYRKAASECVSFWKKEGVDVLGYNSIENAKDINSLRIHLNADKVTLWGISYGSHLALTALKVMPNKIDKMVLASVEGLNQTVKLPIRTDAYFDRLQLAINKQPKAKVTYSDIKGMMHRVHKQLKEKPIKLKIPQKDGSQLDFLFQHFHMQGLASGMIADPQRGVAKLLELYKNIEIGKFESLPYFVKRARFDNGNISFNVMSFAMDIASGMTPKRESLVNNQVKTSLLGSMLNFPMPQLNKSVVNLDLGDEFRRIPHSDVPTLVLTGTLDGRTYIEGQKEATRGLTNLTQVMVVNAGHNLFMVSPKVTDTIKSFLNGNKIDSFEIMNKLPQFIK